LGLISKIQPQIFLFFPKKPRKNTGKAALGGENRPCRARGQLLRQAVYLCGRYGALALSTSWMADFIEFFKIITNPESIILYGGLVLIFAIVFAENGVFFALFLPGESLVFLSGVFCKLGTLAHSLPVVMGVCFGGAFLGYQFGYWFGAKSGRVLFRRQDTWFFKRRHLALARAYHRRYGWKVIVVGRFVPVVRTFTSILSGAIGLCPRRFALLNGFSSALFVFPFVLLGYLAGSVVPDPGQYIPFVFIGLGVIVLVPLLKPLYRKIFPQRA
jgi:membrane-associated protein